MRNDEIYNEYPIEEDEPTMKTTGCGLYFLIMVICFIGIIITLIFK